MGSDNEFFFSTTMDALTRLPHASSKETWLLEEGSDGECSKANVEANGR